MRAGIRATIILVMIFVPTMALATHIPGGDEVISFDGPLAPGTPSTGAIGWAEPIDGYDWYCLNVTSGGSVTLTVTRTNGDIFPNLGVMVGLAEAGATAGSLEILTSTSNPDQTSASLTFSPEITGPVTIWVSTFLGENQGQYTLTATGGTARTSCGATVETPPGPQITVVLPIEEQFVSNDSTLTIPVQVHTAAGFNSDVELSAGGMPNDVTLTLSPGGFEAPGRGNATLTIRTTANTLPGTYAVWVVGTGGLQSGGAAVLVTIACDPPVILGIHQPRDQELSAGVKGVLEVQASGTGPLGYQWYTGNRGSTTFPVAGATTNRIEINSGDERKYYWVRVSNACGTADSITASIGPPRQRAVRRPK